MSTIKKAFSLIELMAIIAIIGILAAVAIPSYKTYMIKSRVSSAIPILSNAMDLAIQYYDGGGSYPNPFSVYGNSMAIASYATINIPPAIGLWYNTVTASHSVHMCIFFSSTLGTPGYTTPTGNNGYYNRICMNAIQVNGAWQKYCGIWGTGETMDIQTQYLPSGCNCNWVRNTSTGGANCNH